MVALRGLSTDERSPELEVARERMAGACDEGDVEACVVHGGIASRARACDLGRAEGCLAMGVVEGEDPLYWMQRACAVGALGACSGAADLLHRARRHEERRRVLEVRCSVSPSRCYDLGAMLDQGLGGPPDLAGAFVHFERACADGHERACWEVSQRLRAGSGVPRDPKAADALLDDVLCTDNGFASKAIGQACRERRP